MQRYLTMCLMSPQRKTLEPSQELRNNLIQTLMIKIQDRRSSRQVQVKTESKLNLNRLLDKILQTPGVAKVENDHDEFISKNLDEVLPKLDRGHVVALLKFHAMPKECIEAQGRAAANIMKSIDITMQSLIVFPHADTMNSQAEIQKVLGSFTLVCLMKNVYGNDHTALECNTPSYS